MANCLEVGECPFSTNLVPAAPFSYENIRVQLNLVLSSRPLYGPKSSTNLVPMAPFSFDLSTPINTITTPSTHHQHHHHTINPSSTHHQHHHHTINTPSTHHQHHHHIINTSATHHQHHQHIINTSINTIPTPLGNLGLLFYLFRPKVPQRLRGLFVFVTCAGGLGWWATSLPKA